MRSVLGEEEISDQTSGCTETNKEVGVKCVSSVARNEKLSTLCKLYHLPRRHNCPDQACFLIHTGPARFSRRNCSRTQLAADYYLIHDSRVSSMSSFPHWTRQQYSLNFHNNPLSKLCQMHNHATPSCTYSTSITLRI